MLGKNFLISSLLFLSVILPQEKTSMGGAIGAVTIEGKVWNQVALRPVIPVWKLTFALDLVFYIDQDGNIHREEWDFSSPEKIRNTIIDKIYYIRYGHSSDPLYVKVGALDNVTLGYGILVQHYSNVLFYPDFRKIGLEVSIKRSGYRLSGFTSDLKEKIGLTGLRVESNRFFNALMGLTLVVDRNQYFGLKDRDGDGRPDRLDDFPDDDQYWLDTDGDGLADSDPAEIDRDGDGLPDVDSPEVINAFWEMLETQVGYEFVDNTLKDINPDPFPDLAPEPLDMHKENDPVAAVSLDMGIPILVEEKMGLGFYSQVAVLIGKTINPESGKMARLGSGLIPLGLNMKFGPGRFNLEYRMIPSGNFEFNYWDELYDLQRASYYETAGVPPTLAVRTKESGLGIYGSQKGFYARFVIDMGSWLDISATYQNMQGKLWSSTENAFIEDLNQNFLARAMLTRPISKLHRAEIFYQQKNVPNPFKFENSESTLLGYRVGFQLGSGLVVYYKFNRTFRDVNGDGDVNDRGETFNLTTFETSFSF